MPSPKSHARRLRNVGKCHFLPTGLCGLAMLPIPARLAGPSHTPSHSHGRPFAVHSLARPHIPLSLAFLVRHFAMGDGQGGRTSCTVQPVPLRTPAVLRRPWAGWSLRHSHGGRGGCGRDLRRAVAERGGSRGGWRPGRINGRPFHKSRPISGRPSMPYLGVWSTPGEPAGGTRLRYLRLFLATAPSKTWISPPRHRPGRHPLRLGPHQLTF